VTNHPKYRVLGGRPAVGKPDSYGKPFYFSEEEEILESNGPRRNISAWE